MNTPPPVTTTIFKDVIKSTVASVPIATVAPSIKIPVPRIPNSGSIVSTPKIKSSHILIGIGLIVGTLVIIYLIRKNRNSPNHVSYN